MTLDELRNYVAKLNPLADVVLSKEEAAKLLAVVVALKAERRAVALAEAGKTRGFDVADAIEATDAALAALGAP
jgi:hypothetical protein